MARIKPNRATSEGRWVTAAWAGDGVGGTTRPEGVRWEVTRTLELRWPGAGSCSGRNKGWRVRLFRSGNSRPHSTNPFSSCSLTHLEAVLGCTTNPPGGYKLLFLRDYKRSLHTQENSHSVKKKKREKDLLESEGWLDIYREGYRGRPVLVRKHLAPKSGLDSKLGLTGAWLRACSSPTAFLSREQRTWAESKVSHSNNFLSLFQPVILKIF